MTDTEGRSSTFIYMLVGAVAFVVAILAILAFGFKDSKGSARRIETDKDRLLATARAHPDPMIRKDFVDGVASGDIRLRVEELGSDVNGTFSVSEGRPTITIETTLISASATTPGQQILFNTLTHEFTHYRQWLKQPAVRDMDALRQDGRKYTEAQCLLAVAIEVEAYGTACAAANRYGWSAAIVQCDGISMSFNAVEKLSEDGDRVPECKAIWKSLKSQDMVNATPRREPSAPAESAQPPPQPPPTMSTTIPSPTYLQPPGNRR